MTQVGNWPADRVERRLIAGLIPYARNARTHTDAQVAQIAASIREWGWTNPVIVDEDGTLIAGHGRVLAARQLGIDSVPASIVTDWSEGKKRAYRLTDNVLALKAGWDDDLLRIELGDLAGLDFDLDLIGFSPDELGALMAPGTEGLTDPDEVPEPPAEPVSVLGDVWQLGRHRLVCGDSTTMESVDKALAGVRPHLMVTDPPYGVEYDASWRNSGGVGRAAKGRLREYVVPGDENADWREAWVLFPGDVAYVWSAPGALQIESYTSLAESGFEVRQQIIWGKQHFAIGRGHYHIQHEPCWYAVRKSAVGHWTGSRQQSTLWLIQIGNGYLKGKAEDAAVAHSTQKPVECMKRPIENNSSPGQAVYDPFVGSGTTIIAAEMTGRACHAIELYPPYVDVAVLRWQNFTGQEATHADTGRSFAALAAARAVVLPAAAVVAGADARVEVAMDRKSNGRKSRPVRSVA